MRRYQKKRALKEFHDLHGTESGSDSGTEEKRRKMTDEPNSEMQEQDESLLCTTGRQTGMSVTQFKVGCVAFNKPQTMHIRCFTSERHGRWF